MENIESADTAQKTATAAPPKTWLLESILVTVFLCWPLGIPAIVNATKVESLFYAGHIEEAEKASHQARQWTIAGFCLGLVGLILLVVYFAM